MEEEDKRRFNRRGDSLGGATALTAKLETDNAFVSIAEAILWGEQQIGNRQ